jgi:hypothetical protein
MLCVVSVAFNRPMVAWSSFIARRWALNWYWHPQVLPAYNEVTILWAVAFAARLTVEFWLYQQDAARRAGHGANFVGLALHCFVADRQLLLRSLAAR